MLHKLLGLEESEVAAKLAEARNAENTEQIRSPLARAYAEAHRRSLKLDALAVSNRARAAKVEALEKDLKKRAEQQLKLSNYRMKVRLLRSPALDVNREVSGVVMAHPAFPPCSLLCPCRRSRSFRIYRQ